MTKEKDFPTTIPVMASTRDRLKRTRRGDENYDEYVNRLMDEKEVC